MQSKYIDAGTTASTTISFASNVTAGNTLFLDVRVGANGVTITVSDNLNGTWPAVDVQSNQVGGEINCFSFPNTKAGACTVTVGLSASNTLRLAVEEVSGLVSSSVLDQTATNLAASGTAATVGPITVTTPSSYVRFILDSFNGQTYSNFGLWNLDADTGVHKLVNFFQVTYTGGSYTGSATLGASDFWCACLASYKGLPNSTGNIPRGQLVYTLP
jgi:hypothetical protein